MVYDQNTGIQESENTRQLQLSAPFHLVAPRRVLFAGRKSECSTRSHVAFHSTRCFSTRFSSIPRRGPTLCFKQIFCILFFGVDVAWTVDQRQLVGQLLWLDFAMPGVGVLLVGGLGGSTSGTGPLDGSVNSFKVSLAVHNYGLICSLKQAQLITATNSPFFSS